MGAWPGYETVRTSCELRRRQLKTFPLHITHDSSVHMPGTGKRSGKSHTKKATPASSIKRYLATEPEDPGESDGLGRSPRGRSVSSASRHRPETRHRSPVSSCGSDRERSPREDSRVADLVSGLPTKSDLALMRSGLEKVIKKELSAVRTDLAQVLERVEETEQRLDRHANAIRDLKSSTRNLYIAHRMALYKLEDQENRNRRNNIRIRGLPEATRDDDLAASVRGIFNTLLGNQADHPLKIDRVHRALRPRNLSTDTPRDIICRLHYYEEKEIIMKKAREAESLDFDGAILSFFPDLARETLERRRALKPLTEKLRNAAISDRWGFPSALIAQRNGKSAILRFPEDLPAFCMDLSIEPPELPGWQDGIPGTPPLTTEDQWQKVSRKRHPAHRDSTDEAV